MLPGATKLKQATNCTTLMGEHTPADMVEIKVKDNELIKIDGLKIKSLYTPGHTSDSYSFLLDNYLFSGDTLLINGTGRTDFQNGSSKDAYNSLFNNILKLPEETLVYPGHDYNGKFSSTIGNEKKFNPRLQVKSVDEYVEIMSNLNLSKPEMMDSNVSKNIQLGAN
jgi:glyoxylase-like metal-dependent hydrolase (beta-lactamase superfamily II)